jgi:hypothetical protein
VCLRGSLVCGDTLFARYAHQVCAWYSVGQSGFIFLLSLGIRN